MVCYVRFRVLVEDDEGLSGGAIAGIVIGVLAAVALVVGVSYGLRLYESKRGE